MYTAVRYFYPTGTNGGESIATLDEAFTDPEAARAAARKRWRNAPRETHGRSYLVDLDSPRWAWLRQQFGI